MMKRILSRIALLSAVLLGVGPALAQEEGVIVGEAPRTEASPIRVIPVFGASSFAVDPDLQLDNFDEGFSAGILADFGQGFWSLETGVVTLQSSASRPAGDDAAIIDVDTWGIPLLAKMNLSGKPHETVFIKLGAMPFNATGDVDQFDVLGVAGIGGHIPLGKNSSLVLDASYNRMFTDTGDLSDYQGVSLLAGFSFNL